MDNLINYFPSVLLILMITLTLILLPLINDDRPRHTDQDQDGGQQTIRHTSARPKAD